MSITSELYEFRMSLFDHGEPDEFLLLIWNSKMTLAATETLDMDAKVQYLCTIFRGEALSKFDLMSTDVENTDTSLTADYIIKGLGWFFSCGFTFF